MLQKLVPDLYLVLTNGQKIANAFKKLFWKKIFREYQRSPNNLTSFLFSNLFCFYEHYNKLKGPELIAGPFSGCQLFSEVFFFSDPTTDQF